MFQLRLSPPVLRAARLSCNRLLLMAALIASALPATAQVQLQTAPPVQLPDVNMLDTPPARVPIFFPPDPPVPGARIDRISLLQLPRWDAPPELVSYSGELFYPMLGTRIAEKDFSRKLRERVARYRAQRETLAAEVREQVRTGAAFKSTEALAKLQQEEEKLFQDLYLNGTNWNNHRQWTVSGKPIKGEEALFIARQFEFLRAAVFYRDGLSPSQRLLLHDFVLWFARFRTPATEVTKPPVGPGAIVSFLPAPSHVRLPDPLPRDLALEFQAFLNDKHALQQELVATLLVTDQHPYKKRTDALEKLAKEQQPRIDALEPQAEALRVRLAALSPATETPFPAEVAEKFRAYHDARLILENDLIARLTAVRSDRCRYSSGSEQLIWKSNFKSGGYVSADVFRSPQELMAVVDENYAQAARPAATAQALQDAVRRFKTERAAEHKQLDTQRSQFFLAITRALDPEAPTDQPISDERMKRALQWWQREELRERAALYSDYVAATLHPGLTPPQRRVLRNQALATLALPLPPGIRRPVFRLDTP